MLRRSMRRRGRRRGRRRARRRTQRRMEAVDGAAVPAAEDQAPLAEQEAPAPAAPTAPEESYLDELERLADLRDRGIISDEDFETKKRQLLGI